MDYKNFAIGLAKDAGGIIKKNFTLGMRKEWKGDDTPITATDRAINQMVIDAVCQKFPEQSILAEEGSFMRETSEYTWVCDPVDGTVPFSHGIPTCVFSLALTRRGESILGVVFDPFLDRLWYAEKGSGAFLNERKVSVSSRATLKNSLLGVPYGRGMQFDFAELIGALKNEGVKIINVYSITYMDALVASGEFAGTIFHGNQPYDTAAIKVIVEEAGGRVTDLSGCDQRYDRDGRGHLVSNGVLHDELVRIIKKTVPDLQK